MIINPIWIHPRIIPAVAISSPQALGGVERVSLRAIKPVMSATILPAKGRNVKPSKAETRLTIASVLEGRVISLMFGDELDGSIFFSCAFVVISFLHSILHGFSTLERV